MIFKEFCDKLNECSNTRFDKGRVDLFYQDLLKLNISINDHLFKNFSIWYHDKTLGVNFLDYYKQKLLEKKYKDKLHELL